MGTRLLGIGRLEALTGRAQVLACALVVRMSNASEGVIAEELAKELQKNRELTRKLYTLRGEAPPNEHSDDHSVMEEPNTDARQRSWEVYASMPGVDSLFSGLSKRTPTGGFFTS